MKDCAETVIGGYQHVIPCGTPDDPDAAILGARSFWCRSHRHSFLVMLEDMPGMKLTAKQLKDTETTILAR